MNGINVMACVQTNQTGFRSVYGKESRMQQKYIMISRQTGLKSAGQREEQMTSKEAAPGQKGQKTVRNSRRAGKASAGRRGSSFVLRAFVLAVIFSGMLAGFQMMTRASSREKEQTYKYYTTVTIGYGEDLSDIVYQYCDNSEYETADAYVREICEINSLPYHEGFVPDLKAGAKIVIPYYSTVLK